MAASSTERVIGPTWVQDHVNGIHCDCSSDPCRLNPHVAKHDGVRIEHASIQMREPS